MDVVTHHSRGQTVEPLEVARRRGVCRGHGPDLIERSEILDALRRAYRWAGVHGYHQWAADETRRQGDMRLLSWAEREGSDSLATKRDAARGRVRRARIQQMDVVARHARGLAVEPLEVLRVHRRARNRDRGGRRAADAGSAAIDADHGERIRGAWRQPGHRGEGGRRGNGHA